MKLNFPENFLWGTSTSAGQIETAFDHDFKGLKARDGSVFNRTIDHELHRNEDARIIASIGNAYRCSLDWSRLQRKPKGKFEEDVVKEYRHFLEKLKNKGVTIMLVLHHFANPNWFVEAGSWESENSISLFEDYVKKVVFNFGDLVDYWNTINEPGVYSLMGYVLGFYPPHKKNIFTARKVLNNQSKAHKVVYKIIKEKFSDAQVGISKNTMFINSDSILGYIPAKIFDKLFMDYVSDKFKEVDYVGLSYYGKITFKPLPIIETEKPGELDKLGKVHDKMWEYYPKGLKEILIRFSKKYDKPIIITENGCFTDDDEVRVRSIKDHLRYAYEAIKEGVDLRGYFHWSTFDNFEWQLGLTYRAGLVSVDSKTKKRKLKKSAYFYRKICKNNGFNY